MASSNSWVDLGWQGHPGCNGLWVLMKGPPTLSNPSPSFQTAKSGSWDPWKLQLILTKRPVFHISEASRWPSGYNVSPVGFQTVPGPAWFQFVTFVLIIRSINMLRVSNGNILWVWGQDWGQRTSRGKPSLHMTSRRIRTADWWRITISWQPGAPAKAWKWLRYVLKLSRKDRPNYLSPSP